MELILILWVARLFNTKVVYWFHEPFESFVAYRKGGNSYMWIAQFWLKSTYSRIFSMMCNVVYLPSSKSLNIYNGGLISSKRAQILNLFFVKKTFNETRNIVLSYIGGLNGDHNFEGFVNFAIEFEDYFDSVHVYTRDIIKDSDLSRLKGLSNLRIASGKPLTEIEMERAYNTTRFLWNAYNRSNQSGVLVNGLRFGCIPLINDSTSYIEEVACCSISIEDFENGLFKKANLVQLKEDIGSTFNSAFSVDYAKNILCKL